MTVRMLVLAGMLLMPVASAAQAQTQAIPATAAPTQGRGGQTAPRAQPAELPRLPENVPRPVVVSPESPGQAAARRAGQPVNVKVDVTFRDQTGNEPARTKSVTVVTADGLSGFVRTTAQYTVGPVPLNIDVEPRILTGGKIRLLINVQYTFPAVIPEQRSAGQPLLTSTEVRENLSVVLDDGKSMVVAQSADPVVDRRVTIEVVATILK